MKPASRVPIALSIAGSDPSGGAGIQADLKTFSALRVYGAAAITALTAQNTRGVRAVHGLPADFVRAQIDAVLADLDVQAIKLGMLGGADIVAAVAAALAEGAERVPVILDPVLTAKSGARLLAEDALLALRSQLLPRATLLTPNLPEAAVLLDSVEEEVASAPARTCAKLRELGAAAVLLKGGHGQGPQSIDYFFDGSGLVELPAPRLQTKNTHGTGCTLSAAIAAGVARGLPLLEAVRAAKDYVHQAIAAAADGGFSVGSGEGHGPVHHFHALWPCSGPLG